MEEVFTWAVGVTGRLLRWIVIVFFLARTRYFGMLLLVVIFALMIWL
jgi:hypothetical protein